MYTLSIPSDLDALLDDLGDRRVVMLGECTHGSHEFYIWRAEISKRLVKEKGFDFIAVEGDWPDCFKVNQFIKGNHEYGSSTAEVLKTFDRWPTWMWGNWETAALVEWLRDHNKAHALNNRVGFYGLDVYSLWQSMREMLNFLHKRNSEIAESVKNALTCFQPYEHDEANYARHSLKDHSCRDQVVELLKNIRLRSSQFDDEPEKIFSTEQNALVAVNAERYYHTMMGFDNESWNIRDRHMMETLERLLEFHGKGSKGIVWAHNTHIGDARATDMKKSGMINIGQLAREQVGEEDVYLVGFTSYKGSVIAGSAWGAPMKEMKMPAARKGSLESKLHSESHKDRYLLMSQKENHQYCGPSLHRAIGVVYDPDMDRQKNYMESVTRQRYNALVYIDHTAALLPFHLQPSADLPDSFPWGL
jgi:erythromycin esterase